MRKHTLVLLSTIVCLSCSDSKKDGASSSSAPPTSSATGPNKEWKLDDLGLTVTAPDAAKLSGNQLENVLSNPSEAYINFNNVSANHDCKIDEIKKSGQNVESLDGGRVAYVETTDKIKKLYVCMPADGDKSPLECSSPMVGMLGDPVPDSGMKVLWDICKSMKRK